MQSKLNKLLNSLPLFPRVRHNIFTGTNSWKEWRTMLGQCTKAHDDEQLIQQYEKAFAAKVESQFAYSFGAGRMALYAALEALDIGPGDEVILPAYTCVVVPNAIIYRGAIPVYVDIEPDTFNIDPSKIEAALSDKTKAIFAQHTFGFACDLDAIMAIAQTHGLYVIEDCAHSLGAKYQGKPVGSIGDIGFFSTDHSKVISTLLGGMVTCNNEKIAAKVAAVQQRTPFLPKKVNNRLLRGFLLEFPLTSPLNYWWGKFVLAVCSRLNLTFFWRDENLIEKPANYPYPARLSSPQALLGLSQLEQLDENLAHRRGAYDVIQDLLAANKQSAQESACLRYSFYVKDRQQFEQLFALRWELGIWFTSIAQGRNDELEKIHYQVGSCPIAEFAAQHVVNFPTVERTPHDFMIKQISKNKAAILNNLSSNEALQ